METAQNVYKKVSIGFIIVLITFYIMKYTKVISSVDSILLNYWITPGLWCVVTILYYRYIPRVHGVGKLKLRSNIYAWAFNCGALFIGVNLVAGFIQGFGKSPYSHNLNAILLNTFVVGATLVGRECIRAYLVGTFYRKGHWSLYFVIGLMTFTSINLFRMENYQDLKSVTMFLAQQVGPEAFENILATYLVLYGGPVASMIYLGIVEAFEWLSPILPNLDWLAKCIVGVTVPLVCSTFIANSYMKLVKKTKSYHNEEESLWKWLPTAMVCIIWIWFTVGVFPVYPSVVATGSMMPMIKPGDVVLIDKATTVEELEGLVVGEVIQFRRGDILISHRIIEIVEEDGRKKYRTKGDNNSGEDRELVDMQDVKGTIIHVIPKIGWPTLVLKSDHPDVLEQVEF